MPDTIAQLDIQITSTAKSADDAITRLQSRIGALGSALSGLTTVGTSIGHIESSIGRLRTATDALDSAKIKETATALSSLAKAADKFSTSGIGNIAALSSALRELSSVGEVGDFSGVSTLLNSVTRLSKTTVDPAQFSAIGTAIRELTGTVSTAPEVSENITAFISALARLGGRSISNVPTNIGNISIALDEMFHAMATVPEVRDDVLRFVEAMGRVPSAMRRMGTSATGTASSFNVADAALKGFKSAVNDVINIAKKAGSAIKGMWTSITKGHGLLSGPVGSLLKFAATFFTIQRAWEALKSSISNASALVEIQNVINAVYSSGERAFTGLAGEAQTAAEHLDELAKGAINAYGMSELAFKRYASQFQAMGTALGITNQQVAEAEANLDKWGVMVSKVKDPVTGLNKEFGTMTGQMSDMSMTLTQLAGDIASFYDKDVADVQKMLASGIYSGQTRPLRALGLDLTQANVQAWALNQGLNADMQTMTQSEKVMLRYQYVLSSLGFVMGDFAFTADTFANRWRVLQQQMIQFGSTVGTIFINAFKPVLRVLNRVMDAAIQFAETVLNALGAIFGWTYEISAAGISDDLGLGEMATDMGDIASGAGDTASGLGDAAKNAAKLKTQLQSFDKLNNLSSPGNTGSGGGGGGGGASGGSGAISIAKHTGEGIIKAYESAIDSLHGLGEYISTSLRDALRNIDWDSIYLQARSFGTGLASFLNGLIRPDTFYEVGKTIANSLNTAMEFAFGLGDVFSFKNAGESLNRGLKGFFENFHWDLVKSTVNVWLEGLAQFINNAITPDLFGDIGDFIGNAITTAFTGMKTFFINLDGANIGVSLGEGFNHMISGIDPHEIASAINEALKDAKDAAVELVKKIEWGEVWTKAKTVLSELDIPIVQIVIGYIGLKTAATVVKEAGKALFLKKALQWLGVTEGSTSAVSTTSGTLGAVVGNALSIAIPLSVMLSPFIVLGKFLGDEDYKKTIEESGISSVDAMSSLTPDDATKTKGYELGKTIGEKFAEGFNEMIKNTLAYKIYLKLFATDLEDDIPEEKKDIYGGTSHPAHADSSHIPQSEKNINNGLITVTQSDLLKVPEAHRILPNGRINVTDANTGGVPEAKRTVHGPLKVTSVNQSGLPTSQKTINNAIAKLAKKNGLNASLVSKTLPNTYTAKLIKLTKAPGFTGISLSGSVRGGGGRVVATMKKDGGVFDNGKWSDIPKFADGGVPSVAYGSLFWAGEAGPELVGHVGGRTEVLNASQIAVAVSDGVARANNSVVNALAAQNRILVGILEKKTGISSRDIFTAVRAEAANYQLRTGTPAFQ